MRRERNSLMSFQFGVEAVIGEEGKGDRGTGGQLRVGQSFVAMTPTENIEPRCTEFFRLPSQLEGLPGSL